MFVIEGSDNLGKTTTAQYLVKAAAEHAEEHYETYEESGVRIWPIRYQHMSRPNHAFDFFTDYQDMLSKYAVQDRFHLGALVWHSGVINAARLRLIEGWMLSLGSVVMVMYAEDDEWYKDQLLSSPRQQAFDVDLLVEANRQYRDMVYEDHPMRPYVTCSFGASEMKPYPTKSDLHPMLENWYQLLGEV